MQNWITHDKDNTFTYAGLRQVIDKYLVQDRSSGEIYETPQFMYMLISATLFQNYSKQRRMTYVKKYYDAISNFKINIPTPVMAGVRTPIKQYASCVLVDVDDTLPSIFSSDMAIGNYVAQRAGIGINAGRVRGINASIRGEKSNIQELYLSLKNLKQRLSVVLKTEYVEVRQLFTSLFGTKK